MKKFSLLAQGIKNENIFLPLFLFEIILIIKADKNLL